ncbi:MAG: polysaccharide deacetylase family protein, partial [Chlamydiae bacterium]|nr:polysaccharide deacetylase family protein [Chlamydiota bacterium]
MLITLLYHRAFACRYGNSPEILEKHFSFLKENYPIVLPLDPLDKKKISLCLSFDDATFDFYKIVYPLLHAYDLKALLAVPVGFIAEDTFYSDKERLSALKEFSFHSSPPSHSFCSFKELHEMTLSSRVHIASHGMHHTNLSLPGVDLSLELEVSKKILEQRLSTPIHSFVFPYGKYNKEVLDQAKKHYRLTFRIGNGLNFSW